MVMAVLSVYALVADVNGMQCCCYCDADGEHGDGNRGVVRLCCRGGTLPWTTITAATTATTTTTAATATVTAITSTTVAKNKTQLFVGSLLQ